MMFFIYLCLGVVIAAVLIIFGLIGYGKMQSERKADYAALVAAGWAILIGVSVTFFCYDPLPIGDGQSATIIAYRVDGQTVMVEDVVGDFFEIPSHYLKSYHPAEIQVGQVIKRVGNKVTTTSAFSPKVMERLRQRAA